VNWVIGFGSPAVHRKMDGHTPEEGRGELKECTPTAEKLIQLPRVGSVPGTPVHQSNHT